MFSGLRKHRRWDATPVDGWEGSQPYKSCVFQKCALKDTSEQWQPIAGCPTLPNVPSLQPHVPLPKLVLFSPSMYLMSRLRSAISLQQSRSLCRQAKQAWSMVKCQITANWDLSAQVSARGTLARRGISLVHRDITNNGSGAITTVCSKFCGGLHREVRFAASFA